MDTPDVTTARAIRAAQSAQMVHFTLRAQNAHRAAARAIRPTRSAQRVHFACSKRPPRHSETDSTHRVCFAFSKCAPRRSESDLAESKWRACHEIYTQAPKYCTCRKICTKSSKVRSLPRNSTKTLESAAPVTLPAAPATKSNFDKSVT